MKRLLGVVLVSVSLMVLLGNAGCLPDNFWSDKWGEVVNRSIFGAMNAAIGAFTGGAIQI